MPLPMFYTPVTKLQIPWHWRQQGHCAAYELDFMRCASRVGSARAQYDCQKELADFAECAKRKKQIERTKIMGKERERQKREYLSPLPRDIRETDC